jgi:methyl-accepting chemotaxis protein
MAMPRFLKFRLPRLSGISAIFKKIWGFFFRIGGKLAIMSGLSILLVLGMIACQILNNMAVYESDESSARNHDLVTSVLNIKTAVRGVQLGLAVLRAASSADEINRAKTSFGDRQKELEKTINTALRYVKGAQDRARVQKINGLVDVYMAHMDTIESAKKESVELQPKLGGPDGAEALKRMATLEADMISVTRERALPVAQEMDTLADKIVEVAAAREKDESAAANANIAFYQQITLAFGAGVVLLLIGACMFLMFTVARPMRKLTGGMLELADGNFDVVLPGLGRRDEIGDVAGAVETFKVKSAEKAQREADAKAELDRQAVADKAERDRIAAEERAESDKRSAAEREAATAKVMNEFDAAVGGIVKAAMEGDFSQRVPLEGKDGVIRNLADALNSMCDTIGAVMDDMVRMMSALAEGDLTRRIEAEYQGTYATLKDSANTTADRLSHIVADIKSAAVEVANAASEISTSTTDLSQRTEQQAAGLEQTSASMEEMAATVKKNAENARQANQLTAGTRDVADRGGKVVSTAVSAMSRIEDSSRKISDIIGVIDEIARQTNLLALNAAVEAARAGDAGRGFAVVASEVRSLAQRSSQAAKDIKDLITNSNVQVKEGVDLVNRAGSSLTEIVESIKSVAHIVADIANASHEQSTGIEQVNKALTQMDEVTQQNSALVEENAATAKTLETQSAAMTERVAFFKLDDSIVSEAARPIQSVPSARQARALAPEGAAKTPAAKPAAPAKRGVVGRMQSALATALKQDPDWEEF